MEDHAEEPPASRGTSLQERYELFFENQVRWKARITAKEQLAKNHNEEGLDPACTFHPVINNGFKGHTRACSFNAKKQAELERRREQDRQRREDEPRAEVYERGCKWLAQAHQHKREVTKRTENKEMQECTFAPTFYTKNSSYWKKPKSQLRAKKDKASEG